MIPLGSIRSTGRSKSRAYEQSTITLSVSFPRRHQSAIAWLKTSRRLKHAFSPNKKAEKDRCALQEQMFCQDVEVNDLRSDAKTLRQQNQGLETNLEEATTLVTALQSRECEKDRLLIASEETISDLRHRVTELEDNLQRRLEEHNNLVERSKELATIEASLRKTASESEDTLAALSARVVKLSEEQNQSKAKLLGFDALHKTVDELRQKAIGERQSHEKQIET